MTVQELINKLNKVENKELPVLFRSTDPSGWTYVLNVDESNVYVDTDGVYDDSGEVGEDEGLVINIDF